METADDSARKEARRQQCDYMYTERRRRATETPEETGDWRSGGDAIVRGVRPNEVSKVEQILDKRRERYLEWCATESADASQDG